jgi:hypothetical protein
LDEESKQNRNIMTIYAAILILASMAVGVLLAAGWIAIVRHVMPDEPRGIHRDDVDREFERDFGPLVEAGHEAYRDRRDE